MATAAGYTGAGRLKRESRTGSERAAVLHRYISSHYLDPAVEMIHTYATMPGQGPALVIGIWGAPLCLYSLLLCNLGQSREHAHSAQSMLSRRAC